ncbi:MAG: prephenate dehydratase [Muribaculaceae bacterium]|nr:prephenate dehydratase [Muribaculaceae bacterium]
MNIATSNKPLTVAIQGIAGCFHDAAAREYFGTHPITPLECSTFDSLSLKVASGQADCGIMAIENTIAGPLLPCHELIVNNRLKIVGELKKRITHTIASLPDQQLDDIKCVLSHPMALMQCQEYLNSVDTPSWHAVEAFDTAGAAKMIADNCLKGHAAICPELAAELYGLQILADGIETNKHNFTRFLIIISGENEFIHPETTANKASVVFTLPHTGGALSKVLTILSFYDMNLTKIQSLPIIGREWEYRFYVDLTFDNLERYHTAIDATRPLMGDFIELGLYRECSTPPV